MDKFSSDKLRSLREHRKLTQEVLAELCEVDATTISGWEKGKWEPSLQNALSLARALHVFVETLCDIKSIDYRQITTNKILNDIQDLTENEQQYILDMISGLKKLRTNKT